VNLCRTILLIFLSVLLSPGIVTGQPDRSEREKLADAALESTIKMYDRSLKQNSFIFNGRIYNDVYGGLRGHPYFMEDYWETGRVTFKGQQFDSLYLMYEIYNDLLLLNSYNNLGRVAPIELNSHDIQNFYLHDHSFVFLEADSSSVFPEGFYDAVYKGTSVSIYAKRKKEIHKNMSANGLWEELREADIYYLKKGNMYYRIRNNGSVVKVLEEHKKAVRTYIRKNNIDLKINSERGLVMIVSYFESL